MNQWEALWEYQQANLALAKLNDNLRSTPTYKKYLRLKTACKKYREALDALITQLNIKYAEIDKVSEKYSELQRQYELEKSELDVMESDTLTTSAEATESKKALDKLLASVKHVSQELRTLLAWCANTRKSIDDTSAKLEAAAADRENTKQLCDKERSDAVPEAERLKADILAKRAEVPEELLQKYNTLCKSMSNPVARLDGDTCGGCHMSLSAVIVRRVTSGTGNVECENCHRILIPQQ